MAFILLVFGYPNHGKSDLADKLVAAHAFHPTHVDVV